MVYRTKLPDTASVANSQGDGGLLSPSAERNSAPIIGLIKRIAPETGEALEIASGTGQHYKISIVFTQPIMVTFRG